MKIALMTNNYKPFLGGVPISVERLADALRTQGHEVTVFAPTYEGQTEEEGVFRYSTCIKKFIGGIVLPNPFDRRIEEAFQTQEFDVIHVHHPVLIGRRAVQLSRKYGIPLTFTYHTRYEQYLSYLKGVRFLESRALSENSVSGRLSKRILHLLQDIVAPLYLRRFLRHCDRIFAPTEGMLDYLHTSCKVDRGKLAVLPTGVEERHFQVEEPEKEEVREKLGAQDCPLFLSVSRMSHEKNVEFLVRSVALAKQNMQGRGICPKFRFVLVGDGPDRAAYETLCRELHVEEEISFVGTVPNQEIAPYFAAADAFLFASKTETQGIVILEAFAGGTPVWAVDASGVRDLVEDGVNGRLFAEDLDAYAEGIAELVERGRDALADYRSAARRTALGYREDTVARKAVSGYTYVCQQKDRREIQKWTNIAY